MRRRATVLALLSLVMIGGLGVWLVAGQAERAEMPINEAAAFPREAGIGACLRITEPPLTESGPIAELLMIEANSQDHLFPSAEMRTAPVGPSDASITIALWPEQAPAGQREALLAMQAPRPCPSEEDGWAFVVTSDLLADGADRLMERAEFGDEWSGRIDVSFHPEDTRVRSTLHFSGPLGIAGSCWIDETLAVDPDSGSTAVVSESGDDAGLAGFVACRRFADELAEGGAGAQALALFPTSLATGPSGTAMWATAIELTDDLVLIHGDVR